MQKLEIIKRKQNLVKLYGIMISFIAIVGFILWQIKKVGKVAIFKIPQANLDAISNVVFFVLGLLILVTLVILPQVAKSKFSVTGHLDLFRDKLKLEVEQNSWVFNLDELKKLSVTISGYDGQQLTGAPSPKPFFAQPRMMGFRVMMVYGITFHLQRTIGTTAMNSI